MELPTYFEDFLKSIRLSKQQQDECKDGHETLRKRLEADKELAPIIVATFLQGSYRRATAIRPTGKDKADVDVIVVTTLDKDQCSPDQALKKFVPFMEKHYKGHYDIQGRSIGIELRHVKLDLVVTAGPPELEAKALQAACVVAGVTPEEAEDWRLVPSWVPMDQRNRSGSWSLMERAKAEDEWKLSPLWIPDREAREWERTHPIAQIQWTWDKNRQCNRHYVNVVKAIKWWRRVNYPKPKYPKSYPLEHLTGDGCPSGIASVACGVAAALEAIASRYEGDAKARRTPFLPDRGVPEHNVLRRVSGDDFAKFHEQVCEGARIARRALDAETVQDSARAWRELFGEEFPEAPPDNDEGKGDAGPKKGGYTPRKEPSIVGGGRFA